MGLKGTFPMVPFLQASLISSSFENQLTSSISSREGIQTAKDYLAVISISWPCLKLLDPWVMMFYLALPSGPL